MTYSLSKELPKGADPNGAKGEQRRLEAYVALFEGRGDPKDADIVLTDLAQVSGYFAVAPTDALSLPRPDLALWHQEGCRAVFKRIMDYLNLPPEALRGLQEAVKLENAAVANGVQEEN